MYVYMYVCMYVCTYECIQTRRMAYLIHFSIPAFLNPMINNTANEASAILLLMCLHKVWVNVTYFWSTTLCLAYACVYENLVLEHKHKHKKNEFVRSSCAYTYAYVTTVFTYILVCLCLCLRAGVNFEGKKRRDTSNLYQSMFARLAH